MKNINKNQTFYIDFDGVILDTMPIYRYIRAKYNLKGDDSTLFRYLNVSDVINRKRAILVICFTIDDANELYNTLLKKEKIDPTKIKKYDRNDSNGKLQKEIYNSGDVIFSTNLAGRGTDIKLTKEVKENRGLHVIVTLIP